MPGHGTCSSIVALALPVAGLRVRMWLLRIAGADAALPRGIIRRPVFNSTREDDLPITGAEHREAGLPHSVRSSRFVLCLVRDLRLW